MAPPARKADRRDALERPHRREHEASVEAAWERHPQGLRDHLREFREACDAEHPDRLHGAGVESEQGVTVRQAADAIARGAAMPTAPDSGGSHMGGPRWSQEFRSYLTAGGSPYATYADDRGEEQWAHPLRSAIARMERSASRVDALAAAYLYLLRRCRNHREAWAAQLGRLADPDLVDVADAWAMECLRRWWRYQCERPRGARLA